MTDADIYVYGNGKNDNQINDIKKLSMNKTKYIDIASYFRYEISFDPIYHIWGLNTNKPKDNFDSIEDIFAHYFRITYKTMNFSQKSS
jgi:hypothetical protein